MVSFPSDTPLLPFGHDTVRNRKFEITPGASRVWWRRWNLHCMHEFRGRRLFFSRDLPFSQGIVSFERTLSFCQRNFTKIRLLLALTGVYSWMLLFSIPSETPTQWWSSLYRYHYRVWYFDGGLHRVITRVVTVHSKRVMDKRRNAVCPDVDFNRSFNVRRGAFYRAMGAADAPPKTARCCLRPSRVHRRDVRGGLFCPFCAARCNRARFFRTHETRIS